MARWRDNEPVRPQSAPVGGRGLLNHVVPAPPWATAAAVGPGEGQGGRGEGGGGRKTFQKIQCALMHRLDAVVFLNLFACVTEAPEVK